MTETSAELAALSKALVKAQGEFEVVSKTANNPFFKSKYADLPSVVLAATPILKENGLAVTQLLGYENEKDTLTTRLLHESGQWLESTMKLYLVKADSQSLGSAVTYSRRYAYMAILGLVADVDDDGNAASGKGRPVQTTAETTKRAAPKAAAPTTIGESGPSTKKLFAMLNGRKDIDDRHKWASGVLGREVVTFTGLGADDIATLEQWFKGNPAPKNNDQQYEPGQEPF